MNVLSLFDGMSAGMIALERAGIKVNNYYASEIDKHAIKVSKSNYPNIIQLGDVTSVDVSTLPKIDLLIGGSPCQGFSMVGKQLAFDDPRSKLYFEYERILKELQVINPNIKFLLENVKMKQEFKDVITSRLGVEPIAINSNLVSAQNRYRLYWTNIEGITQPQDKNIVLDDIIDNSLTLKSPKNTLRCSNGLVVKYLDPYNKREICSKSTSLRTNVNNGNMWVLNGDGVDYRNLTLSECEVLQTVPIGYTRHASEAQSKKMLGNGWTVDVIAHIFQGLKEEPLDEQVIHVMDYEDDVEEI